jgi:hypothetical protein
MGNADRRNRRKLHFLRVNRLTAGDHNLSVTGDLARPADDMFELNTIHKWLALGLRQNAGERAGLAQPGRAFGAFRQEFRDPIDGTAKNLLPLRKRQPRAAVALLPTAHIVPRLVQ